jgi:hypothetical protein
MEKGWAPHPALSAAWITQEGVMRDWRSPVLVMGFAIVALSTLVLVGHIIRWFIPSWFEWLPAYPAMSITVGACFLLTGFALMVIARKGT